MSSQVEQRVKKIAIASDHAGFALKSELVSHLKNKKMEVVDLGTETTESVDYPDYAAKVAESVSLGKTDVGLLVCGTGAGMCITANKFKNIRAAIVTDLETAKMVKAHNNANVICLGGRQTTDPKAAFAIVQTWLDTKFEAGRHEKRLEKIREIERKNLR